jgi:lysophospholipase L1-like esterase
MISADWTRRFGTTTTVVLAVLVPVVLAICSVVVARASGGHDETKFYVSVGDSYTAGYRPGGASGSTTGDGFAYQVLDALNQKGNWELKNFGCTGQSAHGMQFDNGCVAGALAAGGVDYPQRTQEAAAEQFIAEHRGHIGLVTVSMGANDIVKCLDLGDDGEAQGCAESASAAVRQSLGAFLKAVRASVGDDVPIVGVSYMNVFRAAVLKGSAESQRKAALSEVLFRNYLNPTLRDTYAQFNAHFVDTTVLSGGELPESQKALLPGYGTVGTSIARVCELTYFCSDDDPHPNREGHALIARAVEQAMNS